MASPDSTGSPTPATVLRVTTDNTTASAVNANTGGTTDAHAAAVRSNASAGASRIPDRSIKGWRPITSTPAAMLAAPSTATTTSENMSAATTFPANTSPRVRDRVSTVVHVPYLSSDAKMSPPTTLVRTGKIQSAAKPRMTRGVANPDSLACRPKSVSSGRLFCRSIAAANTNGPAAQTASRIRALDCALSFATSTAATVSTLRMVTTSPL